LAARIKDELQIAEADDLKPMVSAGQRPPP
jgi:hypothetical protein